MMQRTGFLHYRRAPALSCAGHPMDRMPRNMATVEEKERGYYAIDPSPADVEGPAPFIPLEVWLASCPPRLSATGTTRQSRDWPRERLTTGLSSLRQPERP